MIKPKKNFVNLIKRSTAWISVPVGIYLHKVNNRALEKDVKYVNHWRRSGIFIVNFERNSHLPLVFLQTCNCRLPYVLNFILQGSECESDVRYR